MVSVWSGLLQAAILRAGSTSSTAEKGSITRALRSVSVNTIWPRYGATAAPIVTEAVPGSELS